MTTDEPRNAHHTRHKEGSPSPISEYNTRIRHTEALAKPTSEPQVRYPNALQSQQRLITYTKCAISESRTAFDASYTSSRRATSAIYSATHPKEGSITEGFRGFGTTKRSHTPQSSAGMLGSLRHHGVADVMSTVRRLLVYLHGKTWSRSAFAGRYSMGMVSPGGMAREK
jgi:hypothetical protein